MEEDDVLSNIEKLKGLSTEELKRLRRLRTPQRPPLFELSTFDVRRLTDDSAQLAERLFACFPEFRQHASMRRRLHGKTELYIEVPAPSGKDTADLAISLIDEELTISFGRWARDAADLVEDEEWRDLSGPEADSLVDQRAIDLIESILSDRLLLLYKKRDSYPLAILEDELPEEMRDKRWKRRRKVRVRSWSGAKDRNIDVPTLRRELGVE
jgi:hypothetical protein